MSDIVFEPFINNIVLYSSVMPQQYHSHPIIIIVIDCQADPLFIIKSPPVVIFTILKLKYINNYVTVCVFLEIHCQPSTTKWPNYHLKICLAPKWN